MTLRLGRWEFDHVVYDERADVLYLSIGEPREPAREEVTPDGHLLRYDDDGDLSGITFVNAKWLLERDGELRVEVHAHVAARGSDLALAFA